MNEALRSIAHSATPVCHAVWRMALRRPLAGIAALALAGCTGLPGLPADRSPGPEPARCESAGRPLMCIEVLPRIGLFNHFVFRSRHSAEPRAGDDTRYDEDGYLARIAPELKQRFDALGPWQLITTAPPAGDGDPPDARYRSRIVTLSLAGAPAGAVCDWSIAAGFDDVDPNEARSCSHRSIRLHSNDEVPVEATVTSRTPAGTAASRTLRGAVPKDFLLVSIGDSYASGEGNPDAPIRRGIFDDAQGGEQLWMDEQCHRSAWAGPVQAGLRLARMRAGWSADGRHPEARARGAITIASVACSGARIGSGLSGAYAGVLPLRDFGRLLPALRQQLSRKLALLFIPQELPAQTAQLRSLIASGGPPRGARTPAIDALSISVGGNDIGFANLIELFVHENVTAKERPAIARHLNERRAELSREYARLAKDLGDFEVEQALITQYPDPIHLPDGSECHAPPSRGLPGAVLSLAGKVITAEESALANDVVIGPLNETVLGAADSHHWHFVAGLVADFRGHGWCAGGRTGNFYAGRPSWLRGLDESLDAQGDAFGTFHPTFEGHDAYAQRIAEAVSLARARRLEIAPAGESIAASDRRVWIAPAAELVFSDPDLRDEAIGATAPIPAVDIHCLGSNGSGVAIAGSRCRIENTGPHGAEVTIRASARHHLTRRRFQREFGPFVIDRRPPELRCRIEGSSVLECAEDDWIASGDRIVLSGADPDSGLARIEVDWRSPQDRRHVARTDAAAIALDGLHDGEHEIRAGASDRLGNRLERLWTLRLDRNPPYLRSFAVHGYDFAAGAERIDSTGGAIAFPIPVQRPASARVVVADDGAGVRSLALRSRTLSEHELGPDPASNGASRNCTERRRELEHEPKFSLSGENLPSDGAMPPPVHSFVIQMDDCHVRSAGIRGIAVLVGAGGPARTAQDWAADDIRDSVASLHAQRVRHLTRRFAEPPATDDWRWPLYALWLNVADGRLAPDASLAGGFTAACRFAAGDSLSSPAFYLLKTAESCLASGADGAEKRALVEAISSAAHAAGWI